MLIFKAIFFLESLVAVLQNGFIVTVLSGEWVRNRMLPAGDTIVACLAASWFCLHGMALLNNIMASFGFCSKINYFSIPWDFINCGVGKAFLLRERKNAYAGITTPSCREKCSGCGASRLGGKNSC